MRSLLNFAAFQVCWFSNVLGAAQGLPWLGPIVTATWMAAHLLNLPRHRARREIAIEARLLVAAAALGWLADSTLVLSGLIAFPDVARFGGPSPLWMVALWVCFAATLRHSLSCLQGRWLCGAALGATGGPLAYLGGEALGAIVITDGAAITAMAVQYAIATPTLLWLIAYMQRSVSAPHAGASGVRL